MRDIPFSYIRTGGGREPRGIEGDQPRSRKRHSNGPSNKTRPVGQGVGELSNNKSNKKPILYVAWRRAFKMPRASFPNLVKVALQGYSYSSICMSRYDIIKPFH